MTPQEQTRLMGMIAGAFEVRTIEDLAAVIRERTGLTFANPRQPTPEEAQRALAVLEQDAGAWAAMRDRGNPQGQSFSAMRTLLYGRIHSPPTDAAGQAIGLEVPPARAGAGQREEFAWLTPEEAGERLRWAERQEEYGGAVNDELHQEHAATLVDIAELKAIRDGTPIPNREAPQPPTPQQQQPVASTETPAQRDARIARLHGDARRDRQHPENAAWKEELQGAYQAKYPDPTPVTNLPGEVQQQLPNVITGPGPIAPATDT